LDRITVKSACDPPGTRCRESTNSFLNVVMLFF
jgi:hypothetical protein